MIKYKKLGLGLSIVVGLLAFFSFGTPKTYAYVQSRADIQSCINSLKFTDIAHIECDAGSSGTITFVDKDPTDGNHNYAPTDPSLFCSVGSTTSPGPRGVPIHTPNYSTNPDMGTVGINLTGVSGTLNKYVIDHNLSTVSSVIYLTYATGTPDCIPYGTPASPHQGDTITLPKPNIGQAGNAKKLLAWSGGNIASLAGVTDGQLKGQSYTRVAGEDPGGGSDHILYQDGNFSAQNCSGRILDTTTDGLTAQVFNISPSNGGSIDNDLKRLLTGSSCQSSVYRYANVDSFGLLGPVPSGLAPNTSGTAGQPTSPGGGNAAGNQSQPTACEANSAGSVFSWMLCPVLDAASSLTNALVTLFTGQLSFRIDNSGTQPANTKAGNLGSLQQAGSGASRVQLTWTVLKDVASAILIIIGLVMVIGQAIERGPFDAYTVKKVLPRLVVAAIAIQLSFSLASWVVNLFDDIGQGLQGIMYLAFGGSRNMGLIELMTNASITGTGGDFTLATLNWGAVAGLAILGVAFPFMMLGVATVAVFGLLAALLTLVFRKILIITLVIFAPVALLAWILPGTQKFWKLWQDNFTKALMMYPIAIAIIAAGRIFAYVVGTQNNGTLLNLLFILVGFFGPLFILPKTFKWGGTVMSMAGNSIMKVGNKMSERPKKFFDSRQEGWSAERLRQSQERYTKGVGFNWQRPWRRPLDLVRSGQWDPTLLGQGGRRRQQAMTRYSAKGFESAQQDIKEADARAQILFSQVDKHDELAQAMAAGDASYQYTTHDGVTRTLGRVSYAERIAGLNAVAKFGGDKNFHFIDRTLNELRNGTESDRNMAKTFLDANAPTLLPKMKHLYYGADRAEAIKGMVGSISEDSFAGMEGAEAQAIVESLTRRLNGGDASAADDISRFLTFYEAAIDNDNIHVGSGVNKAVEALVDGANLAQINTDRTTRGLQPIVRSPAVITNPLVAPRIAALHGRIDQYGNVS